MRNRREVISLANEAYATLRERILRGELPIGAVISRRRIACGLGMSMLPVSQALQRLEFEGLLESRPRAGTRVRIPTVEDVRGHYIVREAMEVQAAKLFAEVATPQERTELQRLAVRVDALSTGSGGDRFLYLTLHERLHRLIAEGTHCRPLCEAIEKNQVLASTWLCSSRPSTANDPPRRHQELVEVLAGRDPEAAAEAMCRHIRNALQNTLQRLEPWFESERGGERPYVRGRKNRPSGSD